MLLRQTEIIKQARMLKNDIILKARIYTDVKLLSFAASRSVELTSKISLCVGICFPPTNTITSESLVSP